ncbi:DUF1571 domain-containing protein [Novipirellula rosea]|uniref:DUF1571 domain-containing protein n=1 Tax=Novipirellula rosea TaxID=1031540 RepID=A0ABP8NPG0_9BACT
MKRDYLLAVPLVAVLFIPASTRLIADEILASANTADRVSSPRLSDEEASLRLSPDSLIPETKKLTAHQQELKRLVKQAQASLDRCRQQVQDYTCTFLAQERVDGRLGPTKRCQAKVRHTYPEDENDDVSTNIYIKFQSPKSIHGREVLWDSHANDGRMLVRKGGKVLGFMTAMIEPASMLAMQGNRYPIHEFGIRRLLERLVDVGNAELSVEHVLVQSRPNVEINGRKCQYFEVVHPVRQEHLPFHIAKVYVDNELRLPILFEAFDWPEGESEDPVLMERYLYCDLKLNVGLTDADFDKSNPEYQFH